MRVPYQHQFQDVSARQEVEIIIRHDGLVTWLNIDGICIARVMSNGFIPIKIDDRRNSPPPKHHLIGEL